MAISAGSRIGPYEIMSEIGAGGMGEVYCAKDSRIGRNVALKVISSRFSADAERIRRFEQEIRASGSLNHPNILSIYDVGVHEGSPYFVSELLEGETLRERLRSSPLPSKRIIELATQIAHGLEAAHGKGIVHRDLKPENLFVTKDGRVKILDFGLAKLSLPESSLPGSSSIETMAKTESGIVLGTVGYMSPEQASGEKPDERSDIFSFGAILYEMFSGRPAFPGKTAVEKLHAILKEDPPPLTQENANVPAVVERIVNHCLEKDPENRFRSAHDLSFALEALSDPAGPFLSEAYISKRHNSIGKVWSRRPYDCLLGGLGRLSTRDLWRSCRQFRSAPSGIPRCKNSIGIKTWGHGAFAPCWTGSVDRNPGPSGSFRRRLPRNFGKCVGGRLVSG